MTQDYNFTSRSPNNQGFNGTNSNGAWSSFMNNNNIGGNGGAYTKTFSWTITFNTYGRQRFYANVDDSGAIYINGNYEMGMGGFGQQSLVSTSNYYGPGTYTLSATSINSGGGPWGIAIDWVDSVPPPPVPGCTNPLATNYNPNADVDNGSCIYPTPSVTLNFNPTAIKRGQSSTLSWSVSNSSTRTLTGQGNVGTTGSINYSPNNTISRTLTASYYGITSKTVTKTLTVYVPPVFSISTNKTEMMLNSTANISWSVSGDGDPLNWTPTLTWLSGGLTNLNLTSNSNVSPSDTTIYTGKVSGVGGTDTGTVTVVVYQPVELSVDPPTNLVYNSQGTINVTTKYATQSITITPTYNYDFLGPSVGAAVNLSVNDSAEIGGTQSTTGYTTTIPYTDRGPLSVSYVVKATGKLGNFKQEAFTIPIIVDDTPENLNIPESDGLIKDQTPVVSPEVEILSELILIDDVDIKVEVKSNYPIQVDRNQDDDWTNLRQIGAAPYVQGSSVGGNSLPIEPEVYSIKSNSAPISIDEEFNVDSNVDITNIGVSSTFTIDPYIYSLYFKMYGASGGGENIAANASLTSTAGTSGGTTSFMGISLSGGTGAGIGGKNGGGFGGGATFGYTWSGTGVSIGSANGSRGGLSGAGSGGLIAGSSKNGGAGSNGVNTYTSSSYHVFDNTNNVHNFSQSGSTSDISLGYANPSAPDGLFGFCPTNGKYYNLTFTNPYVNNSWSFSVTGVCNQAAGGGTGGATYSYMGSRYKSSGGIALWFRTQSGANGYIRCFTITTSGIKSGAVGRGGGGAAAVQATIPYQSLVASGTYAPGAIVPVVIGSAGSRGGTTGGCANGLAGYLTVIQTIFPQVYLSSNKLILKPTDPTATLTWSSAGDLDAIRWPFNGDINNANLNSTSFVSPTVTTTYTAEGYSTTNTDLVSYNPEASLTIVVYALPNIETFDIPDTIDYGQTSFNILYEVEYANIDLKLEFFNSGYTAGPNTGVPFLEKTITLTPSGSAENLSTEGTSEGTSSYSPQWDNFGPRNILVKLSGSGDGGSISQTKTIVVNIDETPDNLGIPETEEAFKSQEPVYTPESVEVVSEAILINDIDISVEIKADYPIQVGVNTTSEWDNLRQIGSGPPTPSGSSVGGNSLPTESGVYLIKPNSDPVSIDEEFNVKSSNITAVDFAKLVTCVSVIDETQNSYYNNQSALNNVWQQSPPVIGGTTNNRRGFRTAFPYRTFYILDPQASGQSGIDVPTAYPADPNAIGPIKVNRDNGNSGNKSDWFAICNFGNLPYGTIVSIWIDISGSMTLATVQASYNYFLTRCANAGIEIVLSLSASGERYIEGHIVYLPPSANFTVNNTNVVTIIQGQSVTLNWVAFGDLNTLNIAPGVLSNATTFNNFVSSTSVSPQSNTTYLLTATGPAGSTTRQVTVNVLIPPTLNISANKTTIVVGTCTNISWDYNGDADTITWTTGTITNGNLTSSSQVCPTDTTTYCAFLDGPAGTSPVTCITIYVKQIPTASLTVPNEVDYGNNFNIQYNTQYANTSISITPTYTYLDGTITTGTSINRTPATSAELGDTDSQTKANGTVPITVPWGDLGPSQISFSINVVGEGGTANDIETTAVNIDQTPDNLSIPETDDLIKSQEPVFSPEGDILSDLILIDDIDVKIEIKANYPIKVDKNQEDDYNNVRQL